MPSCACVKDGSWICTSGGVEDDTLWSELLKEA
jgi:hypothetical protein